MRAKKGQPLFPHITLRFIYDGSTDRGRRETHSPRMLSLLRRSLFPTLPIRDCCSLNLLFSPGLFPTMSLVLFPFCIPFPCCPVFTIRSVGSFHLIFLPSL